MRPSSGMMKNFVTIESRPTLFGTNSVGKKYQFRTIGIRAESLLEYNVYELIEFS